MGQPLGIGDSEINVKKVDLLYKVVNCDIQVSLITKYFVRC